MHYQDAKTAAQREADKSKSPLLLYHDPIGNAEEGANGRGYWGYCPVGNGAELLARFRERKRDETITPCQ